MAGILAAGSFISASAALAAGTSTVQFSPESKIWIEGTSTLHGFSSVAKEWHITAGVASKGPKGQPSLAGLQVELPVKGLKSGESGLDSNLYKALDAETHPTIRFRMTDGRMQVSKSGDVVAEAEGQLDIDGKELATRVRAKGRLSGNTLHLVGSKAIDMTQFGVTPPTLMLGTIRVGQRIVVHYDLVGQLKN